MKEELLNRRGELKCANRSGDYSMTTPFFMNFVLYIDVITSFDHSFGWQIHLLRILPMIHAVYM